MKSTNRSIFANDEHVMQFKNHSAFKLEPLPLYQKPANARDVAYENTDVELPVVPKWNDDLPKPAHMAPRFDYPCPYWHPPVPNRLVELGKIWSIRAGIIYLLASMFIFITIFLWKLMMMAAALKW
jgi:hypothetical protein